MTGGFSASAKKEISIRSARLSPQDRRAFVSGFVRAGGSLVISEGTMRLVLPTLSAAEKKAVTAELREAGGAYLFTGEEGTFIAGGGLTGLFLRLGICRMTDAGAEITGRVPSGLVEEDSCAASYLSGAFLGAGSVSLMGGYHLEYVSSMPGVAEDLVGLLARFGIVARTVARKDKTVTYVKGGEAVSDCLALMGAQEAVLDLNGELAVRSVRRVTNRQNNCDIANIGKTVNASVRQLEDIGLVASRAGLASLPEKLQAVARARLDSPEDSYSELADLLGISKSTLKNRLNRISAIAAELREKDEKRGTGYEKRGTGAENVPENKQADKDIPTNKDRDERNGFDENKETVRAKNGPSGT